MKRVLAAALVAALGLAAVLVARALWLPSRQVRTEPAAAVALDAQAAARHLAESLRFRTVSREAGAEAESAAQFTAFRVWLAATYPRLHGALRLERPAGESLLLRWEGAEPALPALLLLAHHDVVPADDAERWTHPPFAGVVEGGFVVGRGAIDDKGSLVALCEAVEHLLADGFVPRRSVILAFGHDEEVGGDAGARVLAESLASRGVRAALVLDEGLSVVEACLVPGVQAPVALVGVAEKGKATLELVVEAEGGHSSTPPRHTAAGIVASAVHRLERAPLPGRIDGVVAATFDHLAPEMPLAWRIPFANLWLFRGLLGSLLGDHPAVDALQRTTTAVTMLEGSPKDNVLPSRARATVNFRIRPGDSSEGVRAHVASAVDDPRVELRFVGSRREPSPVSPADSAAYAFLQRTIAAHFAEAVVAPALVLGGTDARHYVRVSDHVYRFLPWVLGADDLRAHGIDERLSVANLEASIRFYVNLVRAASEARLDDDAGATSAGS